MKKLMFFLMFAIPILAILVVKLTADFTAGDMFIPVEQIYLNQVEIEANYGDTVQMSYTLYPKVVTNSEVLWSSDNEEIAVVDDKGCVTFVGVGDGHILATTKEGGKRASCSFHVKDSKVHKVELHPEHNYVYIGEKLDLNPNILPVEAINQDLVYTSSDESIATVDINGSVCGIKPGNVTITATSLDNSDCSDSISISVRNPVTALNVNKTEIITAKNSEQIEYSIEPYDATNKAVKFTLDNEEVATIQQDTGTIYFLKAGEVNVTITTVDKGFEQTIKYIFTDGYVYDLVLEKPVINMSVNDAPIYVKCQTIPDHCNTPVEITSSDENIAYVDASGYLHAVKGGSTVISFKAKLNENDIKEKLLYVNINSPATEIAIEDVVTADNYYKLMPTSLPEGSTNEAYFYHLDSPYASVDEFGMVEFTTDSPCEVTVRIYANADESEVYKDVKITYTAGMAYSFEVADKNITINYNSIVSLDYNIVPANATVKNLVITAEENENVIEILNDMRIRAIGGGKAKVKITCELYNGMQAEDYCEISVVRPAEKIIINTNLEFYNEQYVSADNVVEFSGVVLPEDATNKNIIWEVSDNEIAFIREGNLIFNQVGYITLTATVDDVSSSIEVYYAGTNPVDAQVQAIIDDKQVDIPEKIMFNESFEVVLSKIVPNYEDMPQILLEVRNQKTNNSSGKVLEINDNTVTGVAGGTAKLVVYVSNSKRLEFPITVERKPESISVLQPGSEPTTSSVVNLVCEILPYDATNRNIKYVVNNPEIASVNGSVLTFNQVGKADITAIAEGDDTVRINFTVERIEKDAKSIPISNTSVSLNSGDLLTFETSENYTLQIASQSSLESSKNVVNIESDRYVRAVSAGNAVVKVSVNGHIFEIQITVSQLAESIELANDLDFYNDMYVVASPELDLNFNVYPEYATNKNVSTKILKSISQDAKYDRVATIYNNKITFITPGIITVEAKSADENCTSVFVIKYTGGVAEDAVLNITSPVFMNIGDKIVLSVSKWVPQDTVNTRFSIKEVINTSGKKVLDVNDKTITAIDSGIVKLVIELSGGIQKELDITCVNKVKDVLVNQTILTANSTVTIDAQIIPNNATNKTLEYVLDNTDIAQINDNVVTFAKAGTVIVHVRTTDGSEIEKQIEITSTMGYLSKVELDENNIRLKKGESYSLIVNKLPFDAINGDVQFKILSQSETDGNANVVKLDDGKIIAMSTGTAVVRAFTYDFYGTEIYADCEILVYVPLVSMDVKFPENLANYSSKTSFITSRNEIEFSIVCNPQDCQIKEYKYNISNSDLAKVEKNKIKFLKTDQIVEVTITFICIDQVDNQLSVSYKFLYVGDSVYEATLNDDYIQNNIIRLKAGENFKFELEKVLPSDNDNLIFSISNVKENRNDPNKQVASFINGTLHALNGGTYSFTLMVNDNTLGTLTLIVSREAEDLFINGESEVYISIPSYTIYAYVLKTDSDQNKIGFRSLNTSIADVNESGEVTFKQFGECEIEVFVVEKPSISKIVKITYTKELKQIVFNDTRDVTFVGIGINFEVYSIPSDAVDFAYEIYLEGDTDIAELIKKDGYYTLMPKKCGIVTVTARALDKNISISKTITIFDKITKIELDLDKNNDKNGNADYKVFATQFVSADGVVSNTYQMGVKLLPENSPKDLLEWSSNNESVATVDANGIVTFLSPGRVTITVRQIQPYQGAPVASDSYTFTVVEGMNVYNVEQFYNASYKLEDINTDRNNNYAALVLQDNIQIDQRLKRVEFSYNVYGNGFILDHSDVTNDEHFIIERSNIVIDNVILRGVKFSGNESDTPKLIKSGTTLKVYDGENILIYNCTIENAEIALQFICAKGEVIGCIFRNCLTAGIKIVRSEEDVAVVTVKDCIFASSFCGILFEFDEYKSTQQNQLNLEGYVYFYNWSTLDQINNMFDLKGLMGQIGLSSLADKIYDQIGELAQEKGGNFAFKKDGKDYYHFGVVKFNVEVPLNNLTLSTYATVTTKNLNAKCNYTQFDFDGAIKLGVNIKARCEILSLQKDGPFIKPGDRYTDDTQIVANITQKSRF